MRIVRSYSGTLAGSQDWKKVEVEVDENDLASLLNEAGIDISREKIKVRDARALLTCEAELSLQQALVQGFGVRPEEVQEEIAKLKRSKEDALSRIREASGTDKG